MEPGQGSTETKTSPQFESEVIEGPIIPKPKSKFLLILAGTAAVVAIAGAGFLVGLQYGLTPMPSTTATPTPTLATPTPTPDPTANWQTYKSIQGYEIKYPSGWLLQPDKQAPEEIIDLTKALNSLTIYSGSATTGTPDAAPSQTKVRLVGNQSVTEETYNGLFILLKFPNGLAVNQISIRYKNGIPTSEYGDLFDQILSTFKFIN